MRGLQHIRVLIQSLCLCLAEKTRFFKHRYWTGCVTDGSLDLQNKSIERKPASQ